MAGFLIIILAGAYALSLRKQPSLQEKLSGVQKTAIPAARQTITNNTTSASSITSLTTNHPKIHKSANNLMPRPTEIAGEDDEDGADRLKWEQWYNNMHRTAPGVNWKQMDEEARLAKYQSKFIVQNKTEETLANGDIIGTWAEKGSNNLAGRMLLVDIDTIGHYIYGASGGGNIWRGNMDGTNWVCLNEHIKFQYICLLRVFQRPGGGKRILVSTSNNTCYYTDDEGQHWTKSGGLVNAAKWGSTDRGIVVNDSAKTIYLLLQEWDYKKSYAITSIYASKNLGTDFKLISSYKSDTYGPPAKFDLWSSYYGTSGKLYVLNDSIVYTILPKDTVLTHIGHIPYKQAGNVHLAGAENNGKTWLYAMVDSFVFASFDIGKTWKTTGSIGQTPYTKWSFHCAEQNPDFLQVGAVDCWRSADGGASWDRTNHWYDYYIDPAAYLHADIQGLTSFKDDKGQGTAYICNDGGLYRADDEVVNVTNIGLDGLNVGQYYSTFTNGQNTNVCYAAAQDQGFQRSTNGNDTGTMAFKQLISGDYAHIVSGDEGASIWTVYPGFTGYYPDAVGSTDFPTLTFDFAGALWMPPLVADPANPANVYLGGGATSGTASHLFKLTYNGTGIFEQEGSFDFGANGAGAISAIAISPLDLTHRYVMTENGTFYYSTDKGVNWTASKGFKGPAGHYFYGACILASAKTPGRLWISGSGYSNPAVYQSDDDGKTFKAITTGLPSTLVFNIVADTSEQFIFAASELGPYVLNTSTKKWYDMAGTTATDQTYWSVEYIPSLLTVRFGTYGRGIWDFKIDHISSAIKPAVNNESNSSQLNVFPNPAHASVTLQVNGLKPGTVQIRCIDVVGKISQQFNASTGNDGKLEKILDISALKPGIYTIKLIQGESAVTGKLEVR